MLQRPETHRVRREGEPDRKALQELLEKRVRLLRRSKLNRSLCEDLADSLENCSRWSPCNLAACPHCATGDQRTKIHQVQQLWADTPLKKVTMVPTGLQREPGELATITLPSVRRHLRRIFERAGVDHLPIIGFIDVSFNIHSDGLWDDHWQPHLEFLTPIAVWKEMKKPLRKQLERSPSVKIPLLGVTVNNPDHQISYAFKPWPIRKTDFEKESPKARAHKQNLKSDQELEFLLCLGLQQINCRLFMLNARTYSEAIRLL